MFQEIPREPRFEHDAGGHLQVRNHQAMLRRIDDIITQAPEFNSTFYAGFPINALLAWPMATSSGVAAFLDDKVNAHIRDILDAWASFLKSPESTYVLSDDSEHGWFGSMALALMPNFAEEYICDSTKPHYGFKSWDDYFTREFREGIRPVEFPDSASIISNACESAPYCLACGVSLYDRFWMKDQSYSLEEMLAYDSLAPSFEGGTVYQAYLSCTNYHRWHSPMSGIVKKAYRQPGAYYAQCPSVGFDGSTPNGSQAYLTHVATRAIIFIEADNRDIGLTCFMAVGMAECSSCEITVSPGQQVKRGDQLGSFHYGGSTYCLLFQPETRLRFKDESKKSGDDASVLRVNSALAFVESSG
ncbi:MAG: hypothetical protein LQ338_002337 [Usnochroma carphineum]|nr:MAG: hypothetical protein LQ338_002337 [Usnochroma carphineum]